MRDRNGRTGVGILTLTIDWIKIQEPVGDCVSNHSDTVTERSKTSLRTYHELEEELTPMRHTN